MLSTLFPNTLYALLDIEIYIILGILCLATYVIYKIFLKKVTTVRHQNIRNHLRNINRHFFVLTILFTIFKLSFDDLNSLYVVKRLLPYFASITYLTGLFLFVRVCRLNVLMYLFLGSMTAGVPLLIVNIFSLILTIILAFWSVSHIFGVQLTPLLATSAAFSVILGLALQDTLGNLFAGISLQIDNTFEIDDWVEIQNGPVRSVGQVKELSWRATVLTGLSDEIITLPNKVVASSQVSNFSPDGHPIMRSQIFRIPHNQDSQKAKDLLESAISQIADIRAIPSPLAYVSEINENWTTLKIIYFIDNYGRQFLIGDKVFNFGKEILLKNGYNLANQVIEIREV